MFCAAATRRRSRRLRSTMEHCRRRSYGLAALAALASVAFLGAPRSGRSPEAPVPRLREAAPEAGAPGAATRPATGRAARLRVRVTSALDGGPVAGVPVDVVPFMDPSAGRVRIG